MRTNNLNKPDPMAEDSIEVITRWEKNKLLEEVSVDGGKTWWT